MQKSMSLETPEFYREKWEQLIKLIEVIAESLQRSDSQIYIEIQIQTKYILNVLQDFNAEFTHRSDFHSARITLERAQRYLVVFGDIQGDTDLIESVVSQMHVALQHCLISIEKQIKADHEDICYFHLKSKSFKYQFAQLMTDELTAKKLESTLVKIKCSMSRSLSCYISYAWPDPQYQLQEKWIQPMLCQLREHLNMAGITAIIDVKDQTHESVIEFSKIAEECDVVLLVGTPSLKTKYTDPYWRIEKMQQHSLCQRVIPARITGMPDECFLADQSFFTEIDDWRDGGYVYHLKVLISDLLSDQVSASVIESCWAAFWRDCKAYTRPMNGLEGLNTAVLDLFYEDSLSHLVEQSCYLHVKRLRGADHLNLDAFQRTYESKISTICQNFNGRFQLPHPFVDFTGRLGPLQALEEFTARGSATVISHGQHISGTGGIGKTQLAIMFANRQLALNHIYSDQGYAAVIWLHAGSDSMRNSSGLLSQQFNKLGQQLGIDIKTVHGTALTRCIYERLSVVGRCLVVFDNPHTYDSIQAYLPCGPQFHVLITTRNANHADWLQEYAHIILDVFESIDAEEYIRKVLLKECPHYYNETDAKILAETLGYFPLALTQALAYIRENDIPIQEYLIVFNEIPSPRHFIDGDTRQGRRLDFEVVSDAYTHEKNPSSSTFDKHKATVRATILMSMAAIDMPEAIVILRVCSYFASTTPISDQLLSYWAEDEMSCQVALRKLRAYSLINDSLIENHVEMHHLVQEIVKLEDDMIARGVSLYTINDNIIAYYSRSGSPLECGKRHRAMVPHLQCVLGEKNVLDQSFNKMAKAIGFLPVEEATSTTQDFIILRLCLGNSLMNQRNFTEAKSVLTELLQDAEEINAEFPIAVISGKLGSVYLELGDVQRARQYQEKALEIKRRLFGSNSTEIAGDLMNLGSVRFKQGDLKTAKDLYERALAIGETAYGELDLNIAKTLGNLGNVQMALGNIVEGQELFQRALYIKESILGRNHYEVAEAMSSLGSAYRERGGFQHALSLFERAHEMLENHYGHNHSVVALNLMNLASTKGDLGEYQTAVDIYVDVLNIQEKCYHTNHPALALTLTNLGSAYCQLGDLIKAKEVQQRALRIQQNSLGNNHPDLGSTFSALAVTLQTLGQLNEAEQHFRKALLILVPLVGNNNPIVANIYYNMAINKYKLGQRTEAYRDFLKLSQDFSRQFGRGNQLTCAAIAMMTKLQKYKPTENRETRRSIEITDNKLEKWKTNSPGQAIRRATQCSNPSDLVQLLKTYPKHINDCDSNIEKGFSALHLAIFACKINHVRVLLEYDARIDIPDRQGRTAIDCAVELNNPAILLLFKGTVLKQYQQRNFKGQNYEKLVRVCAEFGDAQSVKLLIHSRVSVDVPGPSTGQTALHRAATRGHIECVQLLLAAEADPLTPDINNETVLDLATDQRILSLLQDNTRPKASVNQ